jgi:hypothetical protein
MSFRKDLSVIAILHQLIGAWLSFRVADDSRCVQRGPGIS